jgi:hypothetical protein
VSLPPAALIRALVASLFFAVLLAPPLLAEGKGEPLLVGFAERDITPEVGPGKRPVWMAGYGFNRKATGVHDPIMSRAIVLKQGDDRIAFASVDLIGLQYEAVQKIRERLKGYKHITVASTHNHEGPDVIGIWGPSPFQRGVNEEYLERVIEETAAAIAEAEKTATIAHAAYGTAKDETLVDDSRLPIAKDGVLRVLSFTEPDDGKPAGLLVQWNSHPEALGRNNKLVTADFPASTVAWLKEKYHCPVVYMSGAIGGLMAPPADRIHDDDGNVLKEGDFEYAHRLGLETARLASKAIESAEPVSLTPFAVAEKQVALPVENKIYRLARQLGVLKREGRFWTGDPEKFGEVVREQRPGEPISIVTEISCLRLGDVYIANIPGELYPELVYGHFQDPVDPGADYPDAPLEPTVVSLLPADKWLLFGLANDEVGYIIPKRQWDDTKPFCYGRDKPQYGEINSCGPDVAPILMKAFADCVEQLNK